ncbi:MAG: AbgT family transporter [Myxococcota bacterium]|nr:AbgT family transporter [Myxococcota bacterium]
MALLDRIEHLGNRLPDPITLFLLGALLVMGFSELAVRADWQVHKTVTRDVLAPALGADGEPLIGPAGEPLQVVVRDPGSGEPLREQVEVPVRARSLLSADGIFWAIDSLVDNFKNFPPLAIVLVGMLGIGVADRTGFIEALLKATLLRVPSTLLTPAVFFVGIVSSIGLDAGYVVLPPIAATLYHAVGRPPLVGLAAVFAGVSAGFSANVVITSLDTILAGFSEAGAHLVDPEYAVAATANLWFMIASTVLLTAVGWAITAWFVEPRLRTKPAEEGGPGGEARDEAHELLPEEGSGLRWAGLSVALVLALLVVTVWVPGAPFHGMAGRFPRWVAAIVPLLFLGFLIPGLVYGIRTGALRSDRDVAKLMGETMASMGPYIVMAFFAAQFVEYFRYSGLGEMLAIAGGGVLVAAALPNPVLVLSFVAVVAAANLLIGSMSAKYAFFAPVFVPMLMQVGISPELTQAAYRVGDSVSNVITPLNPYLVIILVFMQRWVPKGGIGTLVALMLPYALGFLLIWSVMLVVWMGLGADLGPGGPLTYTGPGPTGGAD